MPLAPNTVNRILENITQETSELSLSDYLEVLEELKDDLETRIDGVSEDIKREAHKVWEEAVAEEVRQEEIAEEGRAIRDEEERARIQLELDEEDA